jgi:hypothetical protein
MMGILTTGMQMCNINDYVQQLVKGLVLIVAVVSSSISKRSILLWRLTAVSENPASRDRPVPGVLLWQGGFAAGDLPC